jgi:AcrR family transcriptional regulator
MISVMERREEILDHAEQLFRIDGFKGVTLGQIAQSVGIRKPSMYHHFPGGKEELFVEVQIRMYRRVGYELARILTHQEGVQIAQQLHECADWFLTQPPIFLLSMMHTDMSGLSVAAQETVARTSYGLLMQPLVEAVREAIRRGHARSEIDPHTVAGAFLALLEANTITHERGFGLPDLGEMVHHSIDLIILGLVTNTAR